MTTSWLRSDVIFVYGLNRNKSIAYSERRLPIKTALREPGSRNLAIACLDTILRKDNYLSSQLLSTLRNSGISITFYDNSVSTVDLVDDIHAHWSNLAQDNSPFSKTQTNTPIANWDSSVALAIQQSGPPHY